MNKGNASAQSGDYSTAWIHFRNAVQKDPRLAEAHYRLGLASWRLGRTSEAEESLRQALALSHREAAGKLIDLYLSAYGANPAGRQHASERLQILSKRLLDRDPNSYDGLRIQGYLAMTAKQPAQAVEFFRRAQQAGPSSPETAIALCQSLIQAGQPREAEKLALALLAEDRGFAPAYDSLYVLYAAEKRWDDAEAILRRKTGQFPDVAAYVVQLAAHLYHQRPASPDWEQALRGLVTNPRRFPDGPFAAADFYEGARQVDKAIAVLKEGMPGEGVGRLRYQQRIADLHLQQGNKAAARAVIEELAARAPGDPSVAALRAFLRLDSDKPGEISAAVAELSALVRKAPGNTQFRLYLGHAFRARGDLDDARNQYLEAAQRRPQWTPPRLALVEIGLARREYVDALRYAEEIASYEPLTPRLRMLRSAALAGAGLADSAARDLEKLALEFPDQPEPQLELGFIDLARKRLQEAGERFRRLHQPGQKDLRAFAGLVEVRLAQGEAGPAVAMIEEELERSQNPAGVRRLLAVTEARTGRIEAAIRNYRRLAADHGDPLDILFALGELYQRKNDHSQALEWFAKAHAKAPHDPRPAIWIGYSYDQLGRKQEARRSYQTALRLDPENPLGLNNLANLLAEEGSIDEALRHVKRALEKAPRHPEFLDTLGGIYLGQNLPDKAIGIFQDLANKYPTEARFRYRLALALVAQGRKDRARRELETALKNAPSAQLVREIKKLLQRIG